MQAIIIIYQESHPLNIARSPRRAMKMANTCTKYRATVPQDQKYVRYARTVLEVFISCMALVELLLASVIRT